MINDKEVVVAVSLLTPNSWGDSCSNWPCNLIESIKFQPHHALCGGDGTRIIRKNKQYEILFVKWYSPLRIYNVTRPRCIDMETICRLEKCNLETRLRILSRCIFKQELPEKLDLHVARRAIRFSMSYVSLTTLKHRRLTFLHMTYRAINTDFQTLNVRGYTWLCIATIHLRKLPKDVRKLIYNLI